MIFLYVYVLGILGELIQIGWWVIRFIILIGWWVIRFIIVPRRHGEAIGGNIKMLGIRPSVRLCVRHKAC